LDEELRSVRMKKGATAVSLGVLLLGGAGYALWSRAGAPARAESPRSPVAPAERLTFAELLATGPQLGPSAKTRALAGKRVTMVGFMAQMELPPKGAFYLAPRPVHCDEAGGGTADLPLESVLVTSKLAGTGVVPFVPGEVEVTGIFDVGNRADDEGRVSAFRLLLDEPPPSK
jgi:hypothetical protein